MYIQIIGYVAAFLTTVCQVPQALRIVKTRHTKDISFATYTALGLGVFGWIVYGILVRDTIIIVANVVTFVLVAFIWLLKLKYG